MSAGFVSLSALPDAPQPDADLDLRTLRAWLANDEDGDPVLVLQDEDTTVVLDFGLGGRGLDSAIQGTGTLGEAVQTYGNVLHEVRAIKRAGHGSHPAPGRRTVTVTTSEHAAADIVHPHWCVGKAGGCVGPGHRSAELFVPGDGLSGTEVTVSLWSSNGGRAFVALTMTPEPDDSASFALACNLAESIRQSRPSSASSGSVAAADTAEPTPVYQNPDDPEYVTDPHAHDLTIDQTEILHHALGELLAQARHAQPVEQGVGRRVPSSRG